MGQALPPARCGPASSATPPSPASRPAQRAAVSRSGPPVTRASTSPMIGTTAIIRPVSELDRRSSASDSSAQGSMISTTAKTPTPAQRPGSPPDRPAPDRMGHRPRRAHAPPGEHQHRDRDPGARHLDEQIRPAPDAAHQREQRPAPPAHANPFPRHVPVQATGATATLELAAAAAGRREGGPRQPAPPPPPPRRPPPPPPPL